MIKAVLFDLDNTLMHRVNSIEHFAPKLMHYFREALDGVSLDDLTSVLISADNGGYLDPALEFESLKEQIGRLLIRDFPELIEIGSERIGDFWQSVFPDCAQPLAGMNQMLNDLAPNFEMAVLSNGPDYSRQKCAKALGLSMPVFATSTLPAHKPDERAFSSVLSQLGWQASDVAYVGDHPVNDYHGAKNAGLTAIWVSGFHDWPHALPPTHQITDLTELAVVLTKMNDS